MLVKMIHVSAPEKGYIRGRDSKGIGIQHTRERPYLLIAEQELPPEILDKLHTDYPGTDREPVKAEMLSQFNPKRDGKGNIIQPSLIYAIPVEIEIAVKDEGPAPPPAAGAAEEKIPNGERFAKYSFAELQQLAGKAGINCFGLSRDKLTTALMETGVVPSEPQA